MKSHRDTGSLGFGPAERLPPDLRGFLGIDSIPFLVAKVDGDLGFQVAQAFCAKPFHILDQELGRDIGIPGEFVQPPDNHFEEFMAPLAFGIELHGGQPLLLERRSQLCQRLVF